MHAYKPLALTLLVVMYEKEPPPFLDLRKDNYLHLMSSFCFGFPFIANSDCDYVLYVTYVCI